jgi:hypothetical protein
MKKILLIMIIAFGLSACKKSQVAAPSASALTGKWELRETMGGFKDSTYAAGNGTIYQFNGDNTFKHFTNGIQDDQGTYQYKKGVLPYSGYNYDALILNNDTPGEIVTLESDMLIIGTDVADGLQMNFQKILY